MTQTPSGGEQLQARLIGSLRAAGNCAVAYSGGVDSAVVAKAAQLGLGERALAVTAASPSVPPTELRLATELAAEIGIRHIVIPTNELDRGEYVANAKDRCFHCKTELYGQIAARLPEWGMTTIANGTNADDLHDYRPGLIAADQHSVISPLAECGITKQQVREIARDWGLSVWEKPAAPCLASRIAYGQQVTPERLERIDAAEQLLRRLGFAELRVRHHGDDLARIEVPVDQIQRLTDPKLREQITEHFQTLGFRFVTLDLEGFRSGSLNLVQPYLR